MSNLPFHIGLDYHQDQLQLCILDPDGRVLVNGACASDLPAMDQLVLQAAGRVGGYVRGLAVEACCGGGQMASDIAEAHPDWRVRLAHPVTSHA